MKTYSITITTTNPNNIIELYYYSKDSNTENILVIPYDSKNAEVSS